jgi:hypothetical protein
MRLLSVSPQIIAETQTFVSRANLSLRFFDQGVNVFLGQTMLSHFCPNWRAGFLESFALHFPHTVVKYYSVKVYIAIALFLALTVY